MLTGCVSKYKKIKVSSFELESVVPSSLRSANVVVAVPADIGSAKISGAL